MIRLRSVRRRLCPAMLMLVHGRGTTASNDTRNLHAFQVVEIHLHVVRPAADHRTARGCSMNDYNIFGQGYGLRFTARTPSGICEAILLSVEIRTAHDEMTICSFLSQSCALKKICLAFFSTQTRKDAVDQRDPFPTTTCVGVEQSRKQRCCRVSSNRTARHSITTMWPTERSFVRWLR